MTIVIEIVDSLIKKAKSVGDIGNVRFMKAYRQDMTDIAFKGFVCVVNIESVSQTESFAGGYYSDTIKGGVYTVKLSLRVYADNETSGEDLGDTTLKILQAVSEADESKIIESSYIGPITYDKRLQSIYREINASLEFCLCGEN